MKTGTDPTNIEYFNVKSCFLDNDNVACSDSTHVALKPPQELYSTDFNEYLIYTYI